MTRTPSFANPPIWRTPQGTLFLSLLKPRLLYWPILTCSMILVPIWLVSSYAETAGTFVPPPLICVVMPQILESSRSADTGWIVFVDIIFASSWVLLPRSLGHGFGHCFVHVLLPFSTPLPRIGPFYWSLIIYLAVFSVIFLFYSCFTCHLCWPWGRWIKHFTHGKWLI